MSNTYARLARHPWHFTATLVVALAIATVLLTLRFMTPATAAPLGPYNGTDGVKDTNTAAHPVNCGPDLPSGKDDNAFGQGAKDDIENPTVVSGSIPPNKSDLDEFCSGFIQAGDNYLYLYWHRTNVLGTANFSFEYNQKACPPDCTGNGVTPERTEGDLLLVYDFAASGSKLNLGISKWVTTGAASQCEKANTIPCWGEVAVPTAGQLEISINPDELRGEAVLDLTTSGIIPSGTCVVFQSVFVKGRSSSAFGAELKDFIAPIPANINTCGGITIEKQTDPDGATAVFHFAKSGNSLSAPGTTSSGCQNPTTSSFDLSDDGQCVYPTANPCPSSATCYSFTEDDPSTLSPAFALTDITCTADAGSSYATDVPNRRVDIQLGPNGVVHCTFFNQLQLGALRIVKQSTKTGNPLVSNAGTVFTVTPPSDPAFDVTDDDSVAAPDEDATIGEVCVSGLAPGTYSISEKTPPSGYGAGSAVNGSAVVVAGTDCGSNQPASNDSAVFNNPPLSDIQVNFRDGGSGETSATIVCDDDGDPGTPFNPTSTTPPATWDTSGTHEDLAAPTTILCTIEIDP